MKLNFSVNMNTELRKRLEEAAEKYCKDYGRTGEINGYDVTAFKHGGEWMFQECGGMTVLHDMRRLILAQCKEWFEMESARNGKLVVVDEDLLADFESDMNKLWEDKSEQAYYKEVLRRFNEVKKYGM